MTNEQLKPCPMCDSKARISDLNGIANRDDILAIVACADCGVSAYSTSSTEEAVAKWNRRAAPVGEAQPKCHSGVCEGVADDNAALNAENALLRQRLSEAQQGTDESALYDAAVKAWESQTSFEWSVDGMTAAVSAIVEMLAAPTPRLETPEQGEADRRDAWQPIDSAPNGELVLVCWRDDCDELRIEIDVLDPDEGWLSHNDLYEHYCIVAKGGADISYTGPSECAPYKYWKHVGEPVALRAQQKGEPE